MHVHRKSHNSRLSLAGLGLAAAAVAAAGSGQVSGASTTSPAPAAAPIDATSVHDVDFARVAVPGEVCADGLRFSQPREIPVEAGRSPVLDLARMTQVVVDPDVAYADLDGDGADEAVVKVTCTYGANGREDSVLVWTLDRRGEPTVAARLGEPPSDVTGALPGTVAGVEGAAGQVMVTWTSYAPDDPNCCPSQLATVTYGLDGDELVAVGEPVTAPVDAPTA